MVETLGWTCTLLVVIGFWLNARKLHLLAILVWITGDIGWIVYDYYINNFSHLTLGVILVTINLYAIYNFRKK